MKILRRLLAAEPILRPSTERAYPGGCVTTNYHRTSHRQREYQNLQAHIKALELELESARTKLGQREQALATLTDIGRRLEDCIDELALLGGRFNKARLAIALLSPAELRVYKVVKANPQMPRKQLADVLCISKRTVSFHLEHIFQKLGIKGRNEL